MTTMPPAPHYNQRSAAASRFIGRGCFNQFILPPLGVVIFGSLLAAFALSSPVQNRTEQPSGLVLADISPVFTPEVQYWSASILRWASSSGIDPNLVAVIMQIESCGDPKALSGAGASGLFQVMPDHFLPSDDPFAPDTNAARGLDYLGRSLAAAQMDIRLALAGYNAGISMISNGEWTWPAETVRYAYWGSGIYADANGGGQQSVRLNEWLAAGGASLCDRAKLDLGLQN